MTLVVNSNASTPSIDVNGNSIFLPTGGGSFALQSMTGWRNPLINPNFAINQRFGTSSITPTAVTTYFSDRWRYSTSQASKLSTQTISAAGLVGTSAYFQRFSVVTSFTPSSTDYAGFEQAIEADNVSFLNFGTSRASQVTVTFWVRSSVVGTYAVALRSITQNRASLTTFTINNAATWEFKKITFVADTGGTLISGNGSGLTLWFDLGTGSSFQGTNNTVNAANDLTVSGATSFISQIAGSTFDITEITFDAGNTATPFMARPSGIELAMCYRYYNRMTKPFLRGIWTAANVSSRVGTILPVTMRVSPTVSATGTVDMYDGANTSVSSNFTAMYSSPNSIEFDITAASSVMVIGRPCLVYIGSATGYLELNAEL